MQTNRNISYEVMVPINVENNVKRISKFSSEIKIVPYSALTITQIAQCRNCTVSNTANAFGNKK